MQDLKSLGDNPEIKIGNREVALLVGALFLVLVVVFGLGVMVGKRIYEQQPGVATVAATAEVTLAQPISPAAPITAPEPAQTTAQPTATGESYTFMEEMGRKKPTEAPATETPAPPKPAPTPPTTLPTPAPPAVTPKPQPSATAPPATPQKPQPSATASPATPPKPKPTPPSAVPTAAKPVPKPTATTPPTSAAPVDYKWSIQVAAVTIKENADRYVEELKKRGADAWMFEVKPANASGPFYVVRVGHYKSYEEAKKDLESLKASGVIPQDSIIRVKQP